MKHRSLILTSTLVFLSSLLTLPVYSAGGGSGGGGGSTCTEDVWVCGDWGICAVEGKQTRTCTLTFDCDRAANPKPAEEQTCTPSCTADTWICSDWSSCNSSGNKTRTCTLTDDCPLTNTPKPSEFDSCTVATPATVQKLEISEDVPPPVPQPKPKSQVTVPSCKNTTTWQCDDWTACDKHGNQTRKCQEIVRANACPNIEHAPAPEQVQRCQELQCGNKPALRDRVFCRLNLAPAGFARELEIQYLPEECRTLNGGNNVRPPNGWGVAAKACIEKYQAFKPCWEIEEGPKRIACARTALKLGPIISDEVKTCQGKTGAEQVQCKSDVREKVFGLIKFRMYDLEERAEELVEAGADLSAATDFISMVEEKKQAFNAATTYAERRQLILDVRDAWAAFVKIVKPQLQS
ncbi:MAG: hypothetical protein AAB408_00895 [Patescibacteria group bacterium]